MGLVPVFPAEIHFRHQINGIFTRAMGAVGIEMHAANHAVGNIRIFRHCEALHRFQMQGTRRLPERRPRVHGYIPAVFRLLPDHAGVQHDERRFLRVPGGRIAQRLELCGNLAGVGLVHLAADRPDMVRAVHG